MQFIIYSLVVKNTGVKVLNLCCYFDCFIREGWMLSCRVAQTGRNMEDYQWQYAPPVLR